MLHVPEYFYQYSVLHSVPITVFFCYFEYFLLLGFPFVCSHFQAQYISDKYVSPKEFFELIKPKNFGMYHVCWDTLEISAVTMESDSVFSFNMSEIYSIYVNRQQTETIEVRCNNDLPS